MSHQNVASKPLIRVKYLGEIISELKKVVWLARREIIYLTVLVLLVTIAASFFLGAVDFGFSALIDWIVVR